MPKSLERRALGDEKIYRAFYQAYIEFRPFLFSELLKKILAEERTRIIGILDETSAKFAKSPVVELPEMMRVEEYNLEVQKRIKKIFYGEYLQVEVDTEKETCTVLPVEE